jgi:hypothetical protein
MLSMRDEACKEFNKRTGSNISCKMRTYDDYLDLLQTQGLFGDSKTMGTDVDTDPSN